jgi:hypothetical protein
LAVSVSRVWKAAYVEPEGDALFLEGVHGGMVVADGAVVWFQGSPLEHGAFLVLEDTILQRGCAGPSGGGEGEDIEDTKD